MVTVTVMVITTTNNSSSSYQLSNAYYVSSFLVKVFGFFKIYSSKAQGKMELTEKVYREP